MNSTEVPSHAVNTTLADPENHRLNFPVYPHCKQALHNCSTTKKRPEESRTVIIKKNMPINCIYLSVVGKL